MEIAKIYIALPPKDIAIIKYFLEAEDNLGYLRVLDPKIAVLQAITTKEQYSLLYMFLESVQRFGISLTIY